MYKMEYNTTLFKKETIERIIKYFKKIIRCVFANIKISHDLGLAAPEVFRKKDEEFGF